MLQRTLSALDACARVDALVVVVNEEEVEYCQVELVKEQIGKVIAVVDGGDARGISVRNGLRALVGLGIWDLVGIHDGARPLVTCEEVDRAIESLSRDPSLDGVTLAIPSVDTMKTVDAEGIITGTPERSDLWRAQTPQIFRWKAVMSAYDQAEEVLMKATDDSALVQAAGGRVKVVQGSAENLKITDRADFQHAENILAERRQ